MVEIDKDKDMYLFLHGKMDLQQKSVDALVSNGVSKDKIIVAMPDKVGVDAPDIPLAGNEKFTDAMEEVFSKVEMRTRDDPFRI